MSLYLETIQTEGAVPQPPTLSYKISESAETAERPSSSKDNKAELQEKADRCLLGLLGGTYKQQGYNTST